jgi:hypothetical protein
VVNAYIRADARHKRRAAHLYISKGVDRANEQRNCENQQTPVSPTTMRVVVGETLDLAQIQSLLDACAKFGVIKSTFSAADIIATGR